MSASLVGSEMCIRDSFMGDGLTVCDVVDRRPTEPQEQNPNRNGALATACLLYTSDAADDM
eukprot:5645588-Alexandrium_andersonii.AAC.1